MTKRQTTSPVSISLETQVELVSTKGDKAFLKVMKYEEAVQVLKGKHPVMKKKPGWNYKIYQLGFSQFKDVQKI